MSDLITNIWSNAPGDGANSPFGLSFHLPPQSPRLQKAWTPGTCPKETMRNDALAQARVRAIFRSSRFPNIIDNTSAAFDDLESDTLGQLGSNFPFDEADDRLCDASSVLPDFDNEGLLDTEESLSSFGSSLSSRSTPVGDWTPHWYPHLQAVLSSRSNEECLNACRVLVLSTEWDYGELAELAYQLVSSVLIKVPPLVVATCAANFERSLFDASKHEVASQFVLCISESAFAAWHHYWNPGMNFSIYPRRDFKVTKEHLNAAFTFCRLLGSLFKMNLISRVSVRKVIDLILQNAVLLEHIDMLGNLLSYATPAFWSGVLEVEKNRMVVDLYDLLKRLSDYHFLRPELTREYEKKVEEICILVGSS
ncbi:hypothetical protein AN958_01820 [Leucoagaricus sp. SymC.cos]|nr:hypothetical protein AN958_01820 [Leucoagaricus sp. SymC.cos]